jgi:hypothetical protein
MTRRLWAVVVTWLIASAGAAHAQNAIVQENQLPGTPEAQWQIDGAGDLSIGAQLGSGYYIVKMDAGAVVQKRSVLLLR